MIFKSRRGALRRAEERRMVYLCTIERNTASADAWGGSGAPGWQSHLVNVPCMLMVSGGAESAGNDRTAVVINITLYVPVDLDITESDRVGAISGFGGDLYSNLDIESVADTPTRTELSLKRVQ